jgi:hypothetical protein
VQLLYEFPLYFGAEFLLYLKQSFCWRRVQFGLLEQSSVRFGLATFFSEHSSVRFGLAGPGRCLGSVGPGPGRKRISEHSSVRFGLAGPGRCLAISVDRSIDWLVLGLDENVLRRLKTYFTDTDRSYCNIISRDVLCACFF